MSLSAATVLRNELSLHFPDSPGPGTTLALVLPVTLNSYQRLQLHQFVQTEHNALTTFSVGSEPSRRMIVARKDAVKDSVVEAQQPKERPPPPAESRGRGSRRPSRGVYVPPGRARMAAQAATANPAPGILTLEQAHEAQMRLGPNVKYESSAMDVIPGEELVLDADTPPETPSSTFENNILEVFDFNSDLTTTDVLKALQPLSRPSFEFRWVDDTHAILIFETEAMAEAALSREFVGLKLRPLDQGLDESKTKADSLALLKRRVPLPRPETSTLVARRMLSGALGVAMRMPKEQEQKERERLANAKEIKKQQLEWKRKSKVLV